MWCICLLCDWVFRLYHHIIFIYYFLCIVYFCFDIFIPNGVLWVAIRRKSDVKSTSWFTQSNIKKYKTRKPKTMMAYMDFILKFNSTHNRLAIEMNRRLQEADKSECMNKRRTTLTQKDPEKKTSKTTYDRKYPNLWFGKY